MFGESVSEVTPAQFSRVKGFVTATLAIGFATLSMAVSIVVHARLRSEGPSRLSRMLPPGSYGDAEDLPRDLVQFRFRDKSPMSPWTELQGDPRSDSPQTPGRAMSDPEISSIAHALTPTQQPVAAPCSCTASGGRCWQVLWARRW